MIQTAILGIGNLLLKDDGIGIHTINLLEKEINQRQIALIDGGTSITSLLDVFTTYNHIIVVDSLKGGHEPGTIYKITPDVLGEYLKENISLHDVQIFEIVKQARLLGSNPVVTIIGIEPMEIVYEIGLSSVIEKQLPVLLETIKTEAGVKDA